VTKIVTFVVVIAKHALYCFEMSNAGVRKKPETNFRKNKVIPFLKTLNNCFYFPIQQRSLIGDPDFLICLNGTFVSLELKADNGILAPLQEYKANEIRKCKGLSFVVNPSSWDEVKEKLIQISKGEYHDRIKT